MRLLVTELILCLLTAFGLVPRLGRSLTERPALDPGSARPFAHDLTRFALVLWRAAPSITRANCQELQSPGGGMDLTPDNWGNEFSKLASSNFDELEPPE